MNETQNMIYWAVTALAAIALAYALYQNHIRTKKSERTKRGVSKVLRSMAPLREWKVLDDVVLSDKKGEVAADHVVVGPFGVLVFTDIHRRGGYYGELKDAEWVISTATEEKPETMRMHVENPVRNNERFVAALRALLTANEVYSVPVDALCPITQKKAEVFVTGAAPVVVEPGRLREVLGREKYKKDNRVNVERISALLSAPGEK